MASAIPNTMQSAIPSNAYWDKSLIRSQLQDFDRAPTSLSSAEQIHYRQFYSLDMAVEPNIVSVTYQVMGTVATQEGELVTQYWQLESSSSDKGLVVIVHGFYDHLGLYDKLIVQALSQGYDVLGFDLPGHGLSDGKAGEIPSFQAYGDGLAAVVSACQKRFSPNQILLMAQSTGGSAALDYVLRRPNVDVAKMVLFAPLLRLHGWRALRIKFALGRHFLAYVKREKAVSTHDQSFLDFIWHRDVLQFWITPVVWVKSLIEWEAEFSSLGKTSVPTCFIQGTDDSTVDGRYNAATVAKHCQSFEMNWVDGARHHMVNESPEYRKGMFKTAFDFLAG